MKSFNPYSFILMVLFTSLACAAHADNENSDQGLSVDRLSDLVPSANIKLAGKGVENKKTGEAIAIACTGVDPASAEPSCDELRFVYFNPLNHQASYIGSPIKVSQFVPVNKIGKWSPEKQTEYATKQFVKRFKYWKKVRFGMSGDTKAFIGGAGLMVVMGMCALGNSIGGPVGWAFTLGTYPFFLVVVPIVTGDLKMMNGMQKVSSATLDQSGWNWTEAPAKIKSKTFKQLFTYITSGQAKLDVPPVGVQP